MFGLFCNHDWVNVGTGYDDLWKCRHCGKEKEKDPSLKSSLFCDHNWKPYGSLDDNKRCTKCGKVSAIKPGDFAPW